MFVKIRLLSTGVPFTPRTTSDFTQGGHHVQRHESASSTAATAAPTSSTHSNWCAPMSESRLADQVMLKPNFLSSDNQLASSHVDALRGVLDFLITSARAAAPGPHRRGRRRRHVGRLPQLRLPRARNRVPHPPAPARPAPRDGMGVDPDRAGRRQRDDRAHAPHRPRLPCTISIAIPKTHDTCVVTLALKNMIMGTIYRQDRVKMHGFLQPRRALRPR